MAFLKALEKWAAETGTWQHWVVTWGVRDRVSGKAFDDARIDALLGKMSLLSHDRTDRLHYKGVCPAG